MWPYHRFLSGGLLVLIVLTSGSFNSAHDRQTTVPHPLRWGSTLAGELRTWRGSVRSLSQSWGETRPRRAAAHQHALGSFEGESSCLAGGSRTHVRECPHSSQRRLRNGGWRARALLRRGHRGCTGTGPPPRPPRHSRHSWERVSKKPCAHFSRSEEFFGW